jgi:hypothetical protein
MQAHNNANRQCSFCRSGDHNIRKCHSNEAQNLHRFINDTLFDMPNTQQITTLQNNYNIREIKMISVILDLQLFSRKSETTLSAETEEASISPKIIGIKNFIWEKIDN